MSFPALTSLAVVLVCAAVCLCPVVEASNISLSVKRDSRRVIDLGVFGYAAGGKMVFQLKDFFLHDVDEYTTATEKIGFTLDKVVSASFARQERTYAIKQTKKDLGEDLENLCFVDDPAVKPVHRFDIPLQVALNQAMSKYEAASASESNVDVQRQAKQLRGFVAGLTTTVTIPAGKEGLYALFFYNCKKENKNKDPAHVSFSISASQFNVVDSTGAAGGSEPERNYLSVGEYPLSMLYAVAFLVFAFGLFHWHRVLFHSGPEVVRNIRAIHYLMYALVVLKLITLALHVVVLRRRQTTGRMSGGWDYLFYFFQTIKGVALFTIIILLGTGWSILKPFLSDRDRKLLLVVLPLQILANVALAVIEEQSEGLTSWGRWRDALRLFDVGCCCAVLLPVVWSIRSMKEGSSASKAVQRNLARLKQFRTFYIAAVVFIYFTRIVIEFIAEYLPYTLTWISGLLYEVSAVMFYAFVARQFQPSAESIIRSAGVQEDDEPLTMDDPEHRTAVDVGGEKKDRARSSMMRDDDVEDLELNDEEASETVPASGAAQGTKTADAKNTKK